MATYKIFNYKGLHVDTIECKSWSISDGCHMFTDKDGSIISVWPVALMIVKRVKPEVDSTRTDRSEEVLDSTT